jgi:enamine deaminase RidA (YjgF/YER057c/UK114 family)
MPYLPYVCTNPSIMNAIQYINPDGMYKSPAFSQAIITTGPGKTIYIGGQNAVNEQGQVVGADLATQTEQAMKNLTTALAACGADISHVVKMTILYVQGHDLRAGYGVAQKYLTAPRPPVVTAAMVAGLANSECLIEIEATAFLPED